MEHKIEKGYEIPPVIPSSSKGRKPMYPFHEMEVGDSFFSLSPSCDVRSSMYYFLRKFPERNFTVQQWVDENTQKQGSRCWRTK